jgi:hypothetical protein
LWSPEPFWSFLVVARKKEPNKDMRLINISYLRQQLHIMLHLPMRGLKRRHENIADDAGEGNDHQEPSLVEAFDATQEGFENEVGFSLL